MNWIFRGAFIFILLFAFQGCKTEKPELSPNDNIIKVTDANYPSLLTTDKLVVLYFKIYNCTYCAEMEPGIDKLAAKYNCNLVAGKVQFEDNLISTAHFNVKAFPTTYFLKDGKVVDTIIGSYGLDKVEEIIKNYTGECN